VSSTRILNGFSGSLNWGDGIIAGVSGFSSTGLGHNYADDGNYSVNFGGTGFEYDFGGIFGARLNFSNPISAGASVIVQNVAPTIISAPNYIILDYSVSTLFSFGGSATDPGVNDVLTYTWDLDGDGDYDDFTGSSGVYDYSNFIEGSLPLSLRVNDGDGGEATHPFNLTITAVPEPTAVGILAAGTIGLLCRRKRSRA